MHITFKGTFRLTNGVAQALKTEVIKHIGECCKQIYIDLQNIHYIDAKSFEELVILSNMARENNVQLALCNVSDEAYELIDMMQLNDTFIISGHPVDLASSLDNSLN